MRKLRFEISMWWTSYFAGTILSLLAGMWVTKVLGATLAAALAVAAIASAVLALRSMGASVEGEPIVRPQLDTTLSPSTLFLLALVLPRETREAALGDAVERFNADVARFGTGRARWLFYRDLMVDAGRCLLRIVTSPVVALVRAAIKEVTGR